MTQEPENEEEIPLVSKTMEEALDWFTRLRDPQINFTERQEFQIWLAASEENSVAYRKVEKLWGSPALTGAAKIHADDSLPHSPHFQQQNCTRTLTSRFVAIAAIFMLSVSLWFYSDALLRLQSDFYTMAGAQKTVMLKDGSNVLLNTDSMLAVEYQPSLRKVYLLKGEAYFDVRRDTDRPFEVHTKDGVVSVLGTRFTVRSGAQETITVLNGTVAYSQPQNGNDSVLITKGQCLVASTDDIGTIQAVDVDNSFAWLRGRLIFHDRQLADAVTEVERYLPGKVLITNSRLAAFRVTGNYKLQDPHAIIRALAETADAQSTQLSPYLTLLH